MSDKTLELPEGMTADEAADVLGEYHTTDEAQIVSGDTLADKNNTIEELAAVFREALGEQTTLSEDTISAMPVDALCNEFRGEDGEIEPEVLAQTPETGTVETPDENDDPEADTLSADEKAEVREKLDKAEMMGDRTPEYADTLRAEAAEIAGVDDADEIEVDAL